MLLPGRHLILPLTVAAVVGVSSAGMPDADPSRQGRAPGTEDVRLAGSSDGQPATGPAYGTYAWPVRGEVIRMYDPPETPFGSGHRGIDIATLLGVPVRAAQAGTVAFSGPVAGALFVSIDHPDAVRTTYSWLSEVRTRAGEQVDRGAVIGLGGSGHPGIEPPHLHFGARYGGEYIDPMLLLGGGSVVGLVRLAPLEGT